VRERGATVLEVVVALGVLTVIVGASAAGIQAHRLGVSRAWSRLEASRAAASRLEALRADGAPLTAGDSEFTPAMEGARGSQRVRETSPGLHEVAVEVRHESDGVRVVLTTWVVREPGS
jgi:hypothetical protein